MNAALWLADGTTTLIDMNNYSNVAGKTIDNVIGFYAHRTGTTNVAKMTLSGSVAVYSQSLGYGVTTDGTTPATFAMGGAWLAFFFLSDATITSLEMTMWTEYKKSLLIQALSFFASCFKLILGSMVILTSINSRRCSPVMKLSWLVCKIFRQAFSFMASKLG